eukprot:8521898-Heterocapsa_arctica.AAC.1
MNGRHTKDVVTKPKPNPKGLNLVPPAFNASLNKKSAMGPPYRQLMPSGYAGGASSSSSLVQPHLRDKQQAAKKSSIIPESMMFDER